MQNTHALTHIHKGTTYASCVACWVLCSSSAFALNIHAFRQFLCFATEAAVQRGCRKPKIPVAFSGCGFVYPCVCGICHNKLPWILECQLFGWLLTLICCTRCAWELLSARSSLFFSFTFPSTSPPWLLSLYCRSVYHLCMCVCVVYIYATLN